MFVPYRREIVLGSAAALGYSAADLVFPWGTKQFFDQVLGQNKAFLIPVVSLLILIAVVARSFFAFAKNMLAHRAAEKCALTLRKKLAAHLLALSVPFVEKNPTGNLIQLFFHDVESVKRFVVEVLLQLLFASLYIVAVLGFLFWLNPFLALFSALFLPVAALAFFWIAREEKEDLHILKNQQGEWLGRLQEIIRGIKTVVVLRKEKHEERRLFAVGKSALNGAMGVHRRNSGYLALGEGLTAVGIVLLLAAGSLAVLHGKMTAGQLLAFYIAFAYLFLPLGRMVALQGTLQDARASLSRIEKFLNEKPKEIVQPRFKIPLSDWRGDVEFKNVSFGYLPEIPVLQNLSFKIAAGEKVALVGKSGAGKSTLVWLLCRFYSPMLGQLLIGNRDLASLDFSGYSKKLGLVFQEENLWRGSLRENLLYGNSGATGAQLHEAIRAASLEEWVGRQPRGLDTVVGENGALLSGGERKRLAIARAFLRNPAFLILDEATASLDSQSEKQVQEGLNNLMRGRTSLIIAHRLSTVIQADRVLVLHQGKLAEEGPPENLIADGKIFCDLFRDQMRHFLPQVTKM